jgi:glutamate racemase
MDNRPIGFLDSGIGGLSIAGEVHRLLPAEQLVYLADSAHFPYGSIEPSRLCDLTASLTEFLLERHAKLVVVACNTATVHALAFLRARFPGTPFVGVVPVVKTLAEQTRTGTIGLLSTPNTARSRYVADLISRFAAGLTVINVPCGGLADLVESGEMSRTASDVLIASCLAPVVDGGADVVGLGCTHYPFLRPRMEAMLGDRIRVFDSNAPVALRVRSVLADAGMLAGPGVASEHQFFTTRDAEHFSSVVRPLPGVPAHTVQFAGIREPAAIVG